MNDLILANVVSVPAAAERLGEASHSLRETGSLMLISDALAAYELKALADSTFGSEKSLRNEIVWVVFEAGRCRERHATILWYVKDAKLAPFVELSMPRSRQTVRRFGDGRIRSSVNPLTKRRSPARVEGASLATALNDVWVWDDDACAWLSDLDEINGQDFNQFLSRPSLAARTAARAEQALLERLVACAGYGELSRAIASADVSATANANASGPTPTPAETGAAENRRPVISHETWA